MRLPGSIHWKDLQNPKTCLIKGVDPTRRYTLAEIDSALDAVGADPIISKCRTRDKACKSLSSSDIRGTKPPPIPTYFNKDLKDYITYGAREGDRSEKDIRLIRALVLAGWTDSEIIGLFYENPNGCGSKYAESGGQYMDLTIGKARDHVELDLDDTVEATIEGVAWKDQIYGLMVSLKLESGSNVRIKIPHEEVTRWNSLWNAVGIAAPESYNEAKQLIPRLMNQRIRVEPEQRAHGIAILRIWPAVEIQSSDEVA
jgi:hypothetical protein